VDYEERMYAGGRIPGSFFRREGRPTEEAILTARLTDRPVRPLFPKDLRNDVQVIIYSFSTDGENPIDILCVNAASAALMISDVPWHGPVGAVRVGRIEGEFVAFPSYSDLEYSDLDLRVAGTRDAILMVESGASEVTEDVMVAALQFAHQAIQPLIDLQEKMAAEAGKPKREYTPFALDDSLKAAVLERVRGPLEEILNQQYIKSERNEAISALKEAVLAEYSPEGEPAEAGKPGGKDGFRRRLPFGSAAAHPGSGRTARRSWFERHPPALVRGGCRPASPRLGHLYTRRNPGDHPGDAGNTP
jgi:polyribonucleotide nucleotidyltransferase